jgi:hypothetical protein
VGDNKVSPWKSIFYGSGKSTRRNDNPTSWTEMTLPQLAKWYIRSALKFNADYTWREALKATVGGKSNQMDEERLMSFLAMKLSGEDLLEAETLFQACGKKVLVMVAVDAIGEGGDGNLNINNNNGHGKVDGHHLYHGGGEAGNNNKRKRTMEEEAKNKKAPNKKREDRSTVVDHRPQVMKNMGICWLRIALKRTTLTMQPMTSILALKS